MSNRRLNKLKQIQINKIFFFSKVIYYDYIFYGIVFYIEMQMTLLFNLLKNCDAKK